MIPADFDDMCLTEKGLSFFDNNTRRLYSYDSINDQADCFSGKLKGENFRLRGILTHNNYLILVGQYRHQGIMLYEQDTHNEKWYYDDSMDVLPNDRWKPLMCQDKLYLIPEYSTGMVTYFDLNKKIYGSMSGGSLVQNERQFKIQFPLNYDHHLSVLNREKSIAYIVDLFDISIQKKITCEKGVQAVYIKDNCLFKIYRNGSLKLIYGNKERIKDLGVKDVSWVFILKSYISVIPENDNVISLIDKNTYECYLVKLDFSPEEIDHRKTGSNFNDCFEDEKRIYLIPKRVRAVFIIDKETLHAYKVYPFIQDSPEEGSTNSIMLYETAGFGISRYIDMLGKEE